MANNFQFGQPQQPYQAPQYQPPQLFPQPQGNVYLINNSLEVANVPMSAGFSVGLCLSEGLMYLKSMQNGNPMFMAYKISPYNTNATEPQQQQQQNEDSRFQHYDAKISELEKQLNALKNSMGGRLNDAI